MSILILVDDPQSLWDEIIRKIKENEIRTWWRFEKGKITRKEYQYDGSAYFHAKKDADGLSLKFHLSQDINDADGAIRSYYQGHIVETIKYHFPQYRVIVD